MLHGLAVALRRVPLLAGPAVSLGNFWNLSCGGWNVAPPSEIRVTCVHPRLTCLFRLYRVIRGFLPCPLARKISKIPRAFRRNYGPLFAPFFNVLMGGLCRRKQRSCRSLGQQAI
jgi:hypothetical protein